MLLSVQITGYISALPEMNVALVQRYGVANKCGYVTVGIKQPNLQYSYVDMTDFVWDCKAGTWRRQRQSAQDRSVEVAGSMPALIQLLTTLEQAANLLCAEAKLAFYSQWDGK